MNWQITPRRLLDYFSDPDPRRARAAFEAMNTMHKIDIAVLDTAADRASGF